MFIRCPHCGTYASMRQPADQLSCAFCHDTFQPTRLDLLRYHRMQEAASRHQRLAPVNFWGSIGVTVVTGILLMGVLHHGAPEDLFSTVSAWLFPFWVTALTVGIWLISRTRQAEHLPLLQRISMLLLLVLMLPLLYSGLPQGVKQAAQAPAHTLTTVANNR